MFACMPAALESQGDRNFVEQLYLENYGAMYRKARSILKSHADAEDAVEAAMLRILDHIPTLRKCNAASQRSYLIACARNAAIDRLRRDSRFDRFGDVQERLSVLPDEAPPTDALLIRSEQIQAIAAALKRLEPGMRELLRMKYFDEMSDAEIAQLLGVNRDSLRSRVNRARRKLGALLQEVDCDDQ